MSKQSQVQKLFLKLRVHVLSWYNITLTPDKIDIEFVMENYKDKSESRVRNIQYLSISRTEKSKVFSFSPRDGVEIFFNPMVSNFKADFTLLSDLLKENMSQIIQLDADISKHVKNRKNCDKQSFNIQIKSLEKARSICKKNIKAVLNGLF